MNAVNSDADPNKGIPAVFLDRDGTIIEDRGDLSTPSQVVFFEDTVSSLRALSDHFALFIVTNQSGVAKGTISLEEVEAVNRHVTSHLAAHGIRILATYVCPHERKSGCRCIKPNPYFLREAERDFGIDLKRSFAIGDHPHDVHLATNVGAQGIFVLSGHGEQHRDEMPPNTPIASGIREAAEIILRRMASTHAGEGRPEPVCGGTAAMRFCTAVTCMDGRVQLPVIRYLQDHFAVEYVDIISEPGPNLILAQATDEGAMQSILRRIGISVERHSSVGIALAGHHDCAGNPATEPAQRQHLLDGIAFLRRHYPHLPMIALWVDENWEVRRVIESGFCLT